MIKARINLLFLSCLFALPFMAQNTLNIQPGSTLKLSSGALVNIRDMDLINNGELNAASGDGRIIFSGNSNSRIAGGGLTTIDELQITKGNGSSLLLEQNVNIRGGIWFNAGLIDLNNHNITLFGNAALQNESEASRITGPGGGYVQLPMQLNNPQAANPGNLGAVITSSQDLGLVTIRRGHQSQTNASGGGSSILRYYDIEPENNTSLNANLRFHYFDAELNGMNESMLTQWRKDNTNLWKNQGFTNRNVSDNYVEKNGIPAFSVWTLSSAGNPLPVTGLRLYGRRENNTTRLNWETLAEYNNSHFDIERKYVTENNFALIGKKRSAHADGNSLFPTYYDWNDITTRAEGIYYRLRQVDLDGNFSYSNYIFIRPHPSGDFIEKLFPTFNTKESIYIQAGTANVKAMTASIVNMTGQVLMTRQLPYASQWLQLPALPAGTYRVRIVSGDLQFQSAFIKK